jgi:hypothetical protein
VMKMTVNHFSNILLDCTQNIGEQPLLISHFLIKF